MLCSVHVYHIGLLIATPYALTPCVHHTHTLSTTSGYIHTHHGNWINTHTHTHTAGISTLDIRTRLRITEAELALVQREVSDLLVERNTLEVGVHYCTHTHTSIYYVSSHA